jgi:hypothetical protein
MSKFEDILESALQKTSLKQVMIKVDPKNKEDIANAAQYTGYVLEENPEEVTMYVIKPPEGLSNLMTVPGGGGCDAGNHLSMLCDVCKSALVSNGNLDEDDPQLRNIDDAQDASQLVTILKQHGFEDCEILSMFISFFDHEQF